MNKRESAKPYSIRIPIELESCIKELAKKDHRSKAGQIAYLVELGLKEYERQKKAHEAREDSGGEPEETEKPEDPILSCSAG